MAVQATAETAIPNAIRLVRNVRATRSLSSIAAALTAKISRASNWKATVFGVRKMSKDPGETASDVATTAATTRNQSAVSNGKGERSSGSVGGTIREARL